MRARRWHGEHDPRPMTKERKLQWGVKAECRKAAEVRSSSYEPMTDAQRAYLQSLSEEAKVPFEETPTKEQASKRIDELQGITRRALT